MQDREEVGLGSGRMHDTYRTGEWRDAGQEGSRTGEWRDAGQES